jgi:hypothetical protein
MLASYETTLQNWARLAGPLRQQLERKACSQTRSFRISFSGLIAKSIALRDIDFSELSEIAKRSGERLCPLGEPMMQDFGLHRWLAGAQEGAYSDWLQWLFSQMTCEDLARVLDLPELLELGPDILHKRVRVDREVWVDHGHENKLGRLDILIQVGDRALVAIEVKLGSASAADTLKQMGYVKAIEIDPKFSGRLKRYVLLVTESDEGNVCGFKVTDYYILCRNLRRLAIEWMKRQELTVAAVSLMVAASIEENLLRLSLQKSSFTPDTLSHLTKFIERPDYERPC